ncbi:MAG TPA: hypothetical protein VMO81_06985 [Aestuariivirgaceae bacterium]|nr:hypothetical protein [Aestuariivirgaceae bacterium]
MPNKVRFRGPNSAQAIGEIIIQAWEEANNSIDNIVVEDLRGDILAELNPNEQAQTGRVVEVGLIFDENLSSQTRFVWLAIPTPDVRRSGGSDEGWRVYIDRVFGRRGNRNAAEVTKLGESVLFGCGR